MVSKYHPSPRVEEKIEELFSQALARLKKKEEVDEFISEFFTPTEKIMFSKRLAIAVLLAKEYDFRKIGRTLKVGANTVERVNFWMKHAGRHFKKLVKEIIDKEKDEETIHNFWYAIESSTIGLSRGNWGERRKNIEKSHDNFMEKHIV